MYESAILAQALNRNELEDRWEDIVCGRALIDYPVEELQILSEQKRFKQVLKSDLWDESKWGTEGDDWLDRMLDLSD